jgi:hypothetical protein
MQITGPYPNESNLRGNKLSFGCGVFAIEARGFLVVVGQRAERAGRTIASRLFLYGA